MDITKYEIEYEQHDDTKYYVHVDFEFNIKELYFIISSVNIIKILNEIMVFLNDDDDNIYYIKSGKYDDIYFKLVKDNKYILLSSGTPHDNYIDSDIRIILPIKKESLKKNIEKALFDIKLFFKVSS